MHVQDALADAVQNANASEVLERLQRGGRADRADKAGRVPMSLAAALGHTNVLHAILAHRKDRAKAMNLTTCATTAVPVPNLRAVCSYM